MKDAYDFEEFYQLDYSDNINIISQNNELSTPMKINQDKEWDLFYNNDNNGDDVSPEDVLDSQMYQRLETTGVKDSNNVFTMNVTLKK